MSTPDQRLADTFVALAQSQGDAFDSAGFLTKLAHHSVEVLGVGAAGAVLVTTDENKGTQAGASHPGVERLELDAACWLEGPSYDCHCAGELLTDSALDEAQARSCWPQYSARAQALGFIGVAALPLRWQDESVGALVLLRKEPISLSADVLALGQSLADAATVALLRERELAKSRILTAQLEHALSSRVVIEQAKGILAVRLGLPMDTVFDLMRRYTRSHHLRLTDVAGDVVARRRIPGLEEM
ncbi:ANTAR domain-containing protein [Streptomyces sp. MBT27]|uniref:ANTAR domain-containing protein n=1 Tax=Streptomyces sp. MBT27 TaxID=1488356 RepID=UPI0014223657|nr:ANTAR domain-containing protein [Streptomyces sp. MBT27]